VGWAQKPTPLGKPGDRLTAPRHRGWEGHKSQGTRSAHAHASDGWTTLPWPRLQPQGVTRPKCMDRAPRRHDVRPGRKRQRLLCHAWSVRLLAVRQVTHDNRGQRTAGVDGGKCLPPPNATPWHRLSPLMGLPPRSGASESRNRARRTKDRSASLPYVIIGGKGRYFSFADEGLLERG
jgi:hypothetical protein